MTASHEENRKLMGLINLGCSASEGRQSHAGLKIESADSFPKVGESSHVYI